jgi:1-pyrroline-5-carboxylate dehydrogenase
MLEDFRNEPFSNFENAETRSAFEAALARVERRSGAEVPLVVGGRRLRVRSLLDNRNPADRSQILSRHHLADRATARKAIEVGVRAQKAWQELPARERASVLLRAAARMLERKHEFSGSARRGVRPTSRRRKRSTFSSSTRGKRSAGAERSP